MYTSRYLLLLFMAGAMILISCTASRQNKSSVELAMQKYDRLILKLDADSISLLFTPDGNLGDIAKGRDSIKNFLSSFKNIRVLSQSSIAESITITRDTAIQKGKYYQADIIAGKDTVKVKGEYTATWQWIRPHGWYIKRMVTKTVN